MTRQDQQTIPVGYKQTEVGVIPTDWEIKELWDICEIYSFWEKNENKDWVLFMVDMWSVSRDWKLILKKKTNDNFDVLKKWDLIMPTRDIWIGLVIWKVWLIERDDISCANNLYVLRPKDSFNPKALFYFINSFYFQKELNKKIQKWVILMLNKSVVCHEKIKFPKSKDEQTHIATVLSDIDELITQMDELIAKKKAIKQWAMQSLLTPKDDWEVKKLGEIVDFMKWSWLSKTKIVEWWRNSCILYGELFTTYSYVIKDVVSNTNSTEWLPSKYWDILLPWSTTTVGIDLANASALLNDNILLGWDINILRKKYQVNSEFLAYYLTESKKYEIAEQTQWITIIHLYGRSLKNLDIYLPKISEQNQIVTILSDMDNEIQELEQKKSKYEQIKQWAMQQLLTGKIRLV